MKIQADRQPERPTASRNLLPRPAVLAAIVLLMAGVAAARFGLGGLQVGTPRNVAECATMMTATVNTDPTAGEITGTTGMPDHVTYFKARNESVACHSLAGAGSPR